MAQMDHMGLVLLLVGHAILYDGGMTRSGFNNLPWQLVDMGSNLNYVTGNSATLSSCSLHLEFANVVL